MKLSIPEKQNNCINLFKLIAALQVMLMHATEHLKIEVYPIVSKISNIFLGVPIFFTLSGFLIYFSINRTSEKNGYAKYLLKRFLRIYPEMWVAILVEIILLCILYDGIVFGDLGLFTITQSTILQFWTPDSLRGYGCGTPNGSLWTISVTIQFYIIAWFIVKLLKGKRWYTWALAIIGSIVINQLLEFALDGLGIEILSKLYHQTIIRYLWLFLLGMGVADFYDKLIPYLKRLWPLLLALRIVTLFTGFDFSVAYEVLSSTLIFLSIIGFTYAFPRLKLKWDISYGIFIYHMTVVNAMIALGMTGKPLYLLAAVLISIVIALISTVTIGKYAATKK